jgi:hypothetical protein
MLVIKVELLRLPFSPAESISTLTTALLGWGGAKRKRMTKSPRIDRINLRNNRFGVMGTVYSEGWAWAVLYAPNTRVTESLVRKTWQDNHRGFWRWNDETNDFIHFH